MNSELDRIRKEFQIKALIKAADDYKPPPGFEYLLYNDPTPHYIKKPPVKEKTFLYIMRNNRNGYFKISYSKNPIHREKTLQSEDPDITILHKWECEKIVESKTHYNFKKHRLRGEWFSFTFLELLNVLKFISTLTINK